MYAGDVSILLWHPQFPATGVWGRSPLGWLSAQDESPPSTDGEISIYWPALIMVPIGLPIMIVSVLAGAVGNCLAGKPIL